MFGEMREGVTIGFFWKQTVFCCEKYNHPIFQQFAPSGMTMMRPFIRKYRGKDIPHLLYKRTNIQVGSD